MCTILGFVLSLVVSLSGQSSRPAAPTLTSEERRELSTSKQALAKQRRAIVTGLSCRNCAGRGVTTKTGGDKAYGKQTTVQGQVKCTKCGGDGNVIDEQLIAALDAYYKRRDELEAHWPGVTIESRPTLAESMLRDVTLIVTVEKFDGASKSGRGVFAGIVEAKSFYDNRQCDFTIANGIRLRNGEVRQAVTLLFPNGAPPEVPRMLTASLQPKLFVIAYHPAESRTKAMVDEWSNRMSANPLEPTDALHPAGDEGLWRNVLQPHVAHVLACKMVTPTTFKRLRN